MRLVLQRVSEASVTVARELRGRIGRGYLLFLCICKGDTESQARWLAEKVTKLRLFPGTDGTINDRSLLEIGGGALVVSQFTLAGDIAKGNRPDYTAAASPEEAQELYAYFLQQLRALGVEEVEGGVFGAMMQVALVNDGPVTLVMEK